MKISRAGTVPTLAAAVAVAVGTAGGSTPGRSSGQLLAASAAQPAAASPQSVRGLLDRYCVACHSERRVTAAGGGSIGARCAAPGNGARPGRGGHRAPERRRRAVGARDREAQGGLHAPGRAPAARRGRVPRRRGLAGGANRRGGLDEPEPGPDRLDASPEPHGVRQCDPRSPRPRHRRGGAAARGRDVGHRVRQQRGGALHLDRPARAVSVGGAEDLAPRHRGHDGAGVHAVRELGAANAGGPAERGPAARVARRPQRDLPFPRRRQLHLPHRADDQLAGLRPRHGQEEPPRPAYRRAARRAVHGGRRGAGRAGSDDVVAGGGGRPRVGALRPRVGRPPGGPRARRRRTARRRGLVRPEPVGARGTPAAGHEGRGPVE